MATLATDVESTSPPTDNWAVQVPNSTPREEQLLAQLGHAAQKYEALVFKSEAAKAHLTHQKEEVRLRLERIEARFKRAQDQFQELSGENKRYRRELFDLRKSVWTYARIRPRIEQDRSNELIDLVPSDPSKYRRSLVLRKQHKIDRLDADTEFEFDRVFHQSDTNRDVSANVKPMVQAAADDGLNVAIFLEGPSGSGKSHTLFEQDDSIAFSMATYLFERPGFEDEPPRPEIRLYGFKVYQDRLYEALDGACATTLHIASTEARLGVYRDQRFRDRVEGQEVSSAPQLTAAMKRIYDARDKCCTEQNETSSRGHTICMLEFHRCRTAAGELSVSLLFLVDLAGPEPIKQSQNRTETKSITKSRTELQNQLREMVKQHRPNAKFDQNAHDAMKRNLKDSPVARRMNSYSPS